MTGVDWGIEDADESADPEADDANASADADANGAGGSPGAGGDADCVKDGTSGADDGTSGASGDAGTGGTAATDDPSRGPADRTAADDGTGGWTRLRRLRVAVGFGAFAAGLVLVAGAGWLPLSGLAGTVSRSVVVLLGVVAVLQALWAAFRARSVSPDVADPPDPEPVGLDRPPVAGGEFDAAVERLADPASPDADARERVRKDLRRTAVTLLAEREGVSREEAARLVTKGDWTDDPRAAAFLGGPDAATVPVAVRVREWLAPETPAGQRARRAADEVVALAEEGP